MNWIRERVWIVSASALALVLAPLLARAQVAVGARVETVPVSSSGDAADDLAIWVHPTHPGLSLVIGTDKQSGLALYDLAGNQLQFLPRGRLNNVDIRYHFPLGPSEVTLVASAERDQDVLVVYAVHTLTRTLHEVSARSIALGFEAYGCCMYRSPVTGDTYFFVTSEDGDAQQWRLFDAGAGLVDATLVRSFHVGGQSEGCVADDESGLLFIAEEEVGIWRYGAEPGDGNARVLVDATGAGGNLAEDVEGLAIYYAANGAGYLLASSQGNDSFVAYARAAPHVHAATFQVAAAASLGIDAVSGTDGIDVTNLRLGNAFPGGLFVVQDDVNPGGNQNFKLVAWEEIAAATTPPLLVDSSYDPQRTRCEAAAWSYRNGSGRNPALLVNLQTPLLGSTWASELDCTGHANGLAGLFGFSAPAAGRMLPSGELLVDLSSDYLFSLAEPHGGGVVRFEAAIPPDLGLCGLALSVQGVCRGAPRAVLSNAIDLRVGR